MLTGPPLELLRVNVSASLSPPICATTPRAGVSAAQQFESAVKWKLHDLPRLDAMRAIGADRIYWAALAINDYWTHERP